MPRPDISMSAVEVASFIAGASTAVLAANGTDGFVAEVVPFTLFGDAIKATPSQKFLAAIEDDPRICVTVEEFGSYEQLRGAVIHATARVENDGVVVAVTDDVVSFDFRKL